MACHIIASVNQITTQMNEIHHSWSEDTFRSFVESSILQDSSDSTYKDTFP